MRRRAPDQPTIIVTEAAPLPQQTIREQSFVAYENDSYAKAHAQAVEQLTRRYPGSYEYVAAEKSLIEQYLKAGKAA